MASFISSIGLTLLPQLGSIVVGSNFKTYPQIEVWYNKLKKSPLQPPNWLFAPVWTGLYASMGYASYLIYRDGIGSERNIALGLYATQLGLNWIWSPIFFHYQKLGLAAVEMATMLATIGATTWSFYGINKNAGNLLIPYLAWVSFATYLCFDIWQRNKNSKANE